MPNRENDDLFTINLSCFIKYSNEFTKINPKQEVPALFIDGQLLFQSVKNSKKLFYFEFLTLSLFTKASNN
jgi:hypothetical protein